MPDMKRVVPITIECTRCKKSVVATIFYARESQSVVGAYVTRVRLPTGWIINPHGAWCNACKF